MYINAQDCLDVLSCEVADLARSEQFPVLGEMLQPFTANSYYSRYNW